MPNTILLATNNDGKITELRSLLVGAAVNFLGLSDFSHVSAVDETGQTFAENARLKAAGYARQTGLISLADDSGLEVAALGGRPGVLSARYGGDATTFARKMANLLDELGQTGGNDRRARFVCAMAFADEQGQILFESEGVCDGRIASFPRGSGGFGYDPLFIPNGYDETFGELSEGIKQKISHRAGAFEQIIPFLRDFIAI